MNKHSGAGLAVVGVLCLGFVSQVNARLLTVQWNSECSSDVQFTLDLEPIPNLETSGTYTLNGFGVLGGAVPLTFPIQGGVVRDPETNTFKVSLFYSNSIGVSFAYGANLDPASLSGPGSVLTSSDLGVASCGGTLAVGM